MESASTRADWTAVVLAGGRSTRFGSDKLQARIDGRRLIDRVLAGLSGDAPLIVVGPPSMSIGMAGAAVVREEPAFGGPVAAIAAALPLVGTGLVGIIAADMPVAARHLPGLVDDLPPDADALLPVDPVGRLQVLCGAYRVTALREAITAAGDPSGQSMRAVVLRLRVRTVRWPAAWTWDVDTPADLELGEHVLAIEADEGVGDQDGEAADGQG